jgi:hypothetical protein
MKKISKVKMTMFIGDLIAMFSKTIVMANKNACIEFLGCLQHPSKFYMNVFACT